MQISESIMEEMGFRLLMPGEGYAAVFHSLRVYAIRGFTVESQCTDVVSGRLDGFSYSMAVGSSINAISRQLMQDDFTDSEEQWENEHGCKPPYLVVHLGPTVEYESASSYVKEEGGTIMTYDGFRAAKAELELIGDKIYPSLLSALACSFSSENHSVRFVPTDFAKFGITSDGRTIQDTRLTMSASGYAATKLEPAQVERKLSAGVSIANNVNMKAARFFRLALEEEDLLKKFLYFFLAIEIETHATFAKIDHLEMLSKLIAAPSRAALSTQILFDGQRKRLVNIGDRFVWCLLCTWTHLSDMDVEEFKRLKKIRDDIAHGSIAAPPASAAVAAEKLAAKLLSTSV